MQNTFFSGYFTLQVFHWEITGVLLLVHEVQPSLSLVSGRAAKSLYRQIVNKNSKTWTLLGLPIFSISERNEEMKACYLCCPCIIGRDLGCSWWESIFPTYSKIWQQNLQVRRRAGEWDTRVWQLIRHMHNSLYSYYKWFLEHHHSNNNVSIFVTAR